MSDIDKLAINNEVVRLKPILGKTRIAIIRKLVRKLKDAKRQQAKEPTKEKYASQITRFVSHVEYLKKVNLVRLGLLVLASTQEPKLVFSNVDSTVEEFCVAHIFGFKGIKEKMDEIKSKYSLDDSKDWRKVVLEVGKRKRDLINGKPQGGKGTPGKGKFGKKDKFKKDKKSAEQAGKEELSGQNIPKEELNEKKEGQTNGKPADKNNAKANTKNKKKPQKKDGKEKHDSSTAKDSEVESTPSVPKVTTMDSFFITESGSNYMSTAVVDRVQGDGPADGLDRKERRAKQFGRAAPPPRAKKFSKFEDGKQSNGRGKPTGTDGAEHPSWSAKRKQKTIPDFQGKKTKFGEGEGKPQKSQPAAAEGKVHPSWAAKQKLKPTITEFKGSKITFD